MKSSLFYFKPYTFLPEIGLPTHTQGSKASKAYTMHCSALPQMTKVQVGHGRARSTAASFERCFRLDSGRVTKEQIRGQLGQLKQKLDRSAVFNESFSMEIADSKHYMAELRALGVKQTE